MLVKNNIKRYERVRLQPLFERSHPGENLFI